MLQKEIETKKIEGETLTVVERMQEKEIQFAMRNLNKRDMFKANLNQHDQQHFNEIYHKMK